MRNYFSIFEIILARKQNSWGLKSSRHPNLLGNNRFKP